MMPVQLSLVAPVHDEEDVLPEFLHRVRAALDAWGLSAEVILVDDGSGDASWSLIEAAARADARVRGIRLLRNHGHQLALSAGLAAARGELVVTMDADLQDPPEVIGGMIEVLEREQADVVYAVRRSRPGETLRKRATAFVFYRVLRRLAGTYIQADAGDFRLMSRTVVDIINAMPERHRFLRAMVAWIGGRQIPFVYDREERFAGVTKFSTGRMVRLAIDALVSFSLQPIRLSVLLSGITMVIGLGLGVWAVVSSVLLDTTRGWTSLMAVMSLLFALQFLIIGVIGEYVGRIGESVKQRPMFLIKETIGSEGLPTDTGRRSGEVT